VALFAVGIALPLFGLIGGRGSTGEVMENRLPAPAPELPRSAAEIGSFSQRFDAWFADHFGFRGSLIKWNTVATVLWLSSSPDVSSSLDETGGVQHSIDPLRRTTIKGDGDWFYYFGPGMLDDYRGLSPMSTGELEQWRRGFEGRWRDLAAYGIDYLLVFVPEKQSIYPEHLPDAIERHGPSRSEQLATHPLAHSDLPLLYLRPVLERAKAKRRTYHRTGTHWNDFGAFEAYRSILERLAPAHPPLNPPTLADFRLRIERTEARPFLSLIGLRTVLSEELVLLDPPAARAARVVYEHNPEQEFGTYPFAPGSIMIKETGRPELPRALVLHDSFMRVSLEPLLSEHFERVAYYWGRGFPKRPILDRSPDLVIEERSERFFLNDPGTIGFAPRRARRPQRR
jgi:hypothetical protein